MHIQNKVFKDLKVIDLTTVLAGPSVGTFFAELGAEVIKIENPIHPDITRSWKLPDENPNSKVSAYFSSINYKKSYLHLNLNTSEDKEILFQKIKNADIVLMNFKLGDQEKFGITDEVLRTYNQRLIIGKINGFGSESDRVAYDLILQAETGIMSMNGTPESGPVKMPIALIDVLAAHQLKQGILIELISRSQESNYHGKTISASLYESAISSLVNQATNYLMGGHIPERIGSLHPNIAPYGELFKTKDGKTITFAIGSNRHFEILCTYLSLFETIEDERFVTVQNRVKNREILFQILKEEVVKFNSTEILEYMHEHYVPCGEVKDLKMVFEEELAQKLVREEVIEGVVTKRVSSVAFKVK